MDLPYISVWVIGYILIWSAAIVHQKIKMFSQAIQDDVWWVCFFIGTDFENFSIT